MITLDNIFTYIYHQLHEKKDLESCKTILKLYNASDYVQYIREGEYNDYGYKRILVDKCSLFDMYILMWKPGAQSPIHNHPEHGCYMKVLHGELDEYVFDRNCNIHSMYAREEHYIGFMKKDYMLHSIENNTDSIAISLHIYSPPNIKPKLYNVRSLSI